MSLTDTFVYCTNDKFLGTDHNTIRFENGFVCFDDDDAPEAVVKVTPETETVQQAREYVARQLEKLNVPFRNKIRYHNTCGRCFGKDITEGSAQAHSFWIIINGPIPTEVYPEDVKYEDNWHGCLEHLTVPEEKRPALVHARHGR